MQLVYDGGTTAKGRYFVGRHNFSINHPTGFTEGLYKVTLRTQSMNRFLSGAIGCNANGAPRPSFDFACPEDTPSFDFWVQVETSARVTISADCNTLNFTARTSSGKDYTAVLWKDGVSTGRSRTVASGASGTFSLSMYNDGARHEYSILVEDTATGAKAFSNTVHNESCLGGGGGGDEPPVTECRGFNPNVTVSLPDMSPIDNGSPDDTTSAGATYTQYRRDDRTRVLGTTDISIGGKRVGSGSFHLPLLSEAYESATISYQPFIDQCPYDVSQGSVTYRSYYDQRSWRASSSPDYYTCSSGTLDGSRCRHSSPASKVCVLKSSDGKICLDSDYICYSGTLSGTSCISYTDATAWYEFSLTSGWSDQYRDNTVNGPEMQPCYERTYEVTSVQPVSITFKDSGGNVNYESPSYVEFNTKVDYRYSLDHGGDGWVRQPVRANNVMTQAEYQVEHSDGSRQTYPLGTYSGSSCDNKFPGNIGTDSGGTSLPAIGWPTTFPHSGTINFMDCRQAAIPPLFAGDKACVRVKILHTKGEVRIDGSRTILQVGDSGWSSLVCSNRVVNMPYVSIYGNDVIAGGGFDHDSCIGTGSILGFYDLANRKGSSTQFAALALNSINQFGSAQMRTSAPIAPKGLTFANSGGSYGEGFSPGMQRCIPSYYERKPANLGDTALPSGTLTSSGVSAHSGGSLGAITLDKGVNRVMYIDGDLLITGNIIFNADTWTSRSDISSLYVIVRGDIFIHPNVTLLNGVFVSEPSSSSQGIIYTCGNTVTTSFYVNCGQQLQVNGAFIAKHIRLERAGSSSMRYSTMDEYVYGPNRTCELPYGAPYASVRPVCSAELFNFGPEIFLAEPALPPLGGPKMGTFDSITDLPPIL